MVYPDSPDSIQNPSNNARSGLALFSAVGGAVVLGAVMTPLAAPPVLGLVGFSAAGPVAGTVAAWIQAGLGSVTAGSPFALAQSIAMGGAVPAFGILAGGIIAGIVVYGAGRWILRRWHSRKA